MSDSYKDKINQRRKQQLAARIEAALNPNPGCTNCNLVAGATGQIYLSSFDILNFTLASAQTPKTKKP